MFPGAERESGESMARLPSPDDGKDMRGASRLDAVEPAIRMLRGRIRPILLDERVRPVGNAPVMAELNHVDCASALHYGLEVEDGEEREGLGDCLLIRLGTNEAGTAEDLPLPEDAPAQPGELLLRVRPDGAMDLGEAIRRVLQTYLNATEDNVWRQASPEMSRGRLSDTDSV